jgi:hypothetical protein
MSTPLSNALLVADALARKETEPKDDAEHEQPGDGDDEELTHPDASHRAESTGAEEATEWVEESSQDSRVTLRKALAKVLSEGR